MYKALVIGCGNIGALYDFENGQVLTHAKAIHLHPGFSLSIFDIDKDLVKKTSAKYNCEVADKINEQTMQVFDCVSICTPTSMHFDLFEKAIRASVKVIICEKPLSNDTHELQNAQEIYNAGSSKVIVNYIRRFQPEFKELKKAISELLKTELLTNISITYQKGFLNNCSHAFDTIEYLTGHEVVLKDTCIHNRTFDFFDNDPTLSLQANWNKTNVNVTGLSNVKFTCFEIDLCFEYHRISIKKAGSEIRIYKAGKDRTFQPLKMQREYGDGMKDYMKHVIDYAHDLLIKKEGKDNFPNSVALNMRMLNYMDL